MLAFLPCAPAQVLEIHSFTNLNRVIPDGCWSGLSDVHSITSSIHRLDSLRVRLEVKGEYNGDLYCYIRHSLPSRTDLCVLLNRPGRTSEQLHGYADSGLQVEFDDTAPTNVHVYRAISTPAQGMPLTGVWQPDGRRIDPAAALDTTPVETMLSWFCDDAAGGTWTLFIADVDMGATNMLVSWGLELVGATTPTVRWEQPESISYGTPLGSVQLNASAGSANGTITYEPPAGTVLNAGSHTLTAVFTPADPATHLSTTTSVTIDVLQKALTIAAQNVTKSYDGLAFSGGTVSYDGFVNGETEAVLYGTLGFSGDSQGAISAGSYVIAPGGLTSTNYAITFLDGALHVTRAHLSVTAHSLTMTYNGQPFTGGNGVTLEGFVNGEAVDVLTGSVAYSGNSQGAVDAGSYAIVPGGLSSQNYDLNFVEGILTIQKAATTGLLTASANPVKPQDPVTFSFTLTPVPPGGGTPTGLVRFLVDGVSVGSPMSVVDGVGSYTTPGLTLGTHVVQAEYAGDLNFWGATNGLTPVLLVNTAPLAGTDTVVRAGTNDVKVSVPSLLSNDTDADGDAITFLGVDPTSTNNGALVYHAGWVFYSPPAGSTNEDSFSYMISDGRGVPVTGTVLVSVIVDPVPSPNLVIVDQGNGSYLLQFSGIPGLRYRIQYSEYFPTTEWTPLGSETADATGMFRLLDTPPQGAPRRYYRSVYP